MQHGDLAILELKLSKNNLESYVYDNRNALGEYGNMKDYVDENTKKTFVEQCNAMEQWLYGEGQDASREVYEEKLK